MTLPQANAVRADFLAYDKRTKDAHALLDSILHDDPDNLQAQETMGYLSLFGWEYSGGAELVRACSQAGLGELPDAILFCRHVHEGSRLSAEDAAAVEASLRSAIKLNPSFAPSYDTLATLYGEQHEKLDEAHMLNLQAVTLDPGNVRYRLNTASILLEMNNQADALRVLQQALATAKTARIATRSRAGCRHRSSGFSKQRQRKHRRSKTTPARSTLFNARTSRDPGECRRQRCKPSRRDAPGTDAGLYRDVAECVMLLPLRPRIEDRWRGKNSLSLQQQLCQDRLQRRQLSRPKAISIPATI